MLFDGVSFSLSVRSRIRDLQTDVHHPERTFSWQSSTALFTILTTAGRLQDQRRGGFARGGQLTRNSLFSMSMTTWTYPRKTSGGNLTPLTRVTAPACLDQRDGCNDPSCSTLPARRQKRRSAVFREDELRGV
jgi:hypothetical protein